MSLSLGLISCAYSPPKTGPIALLDLPRMPSQAVRSGREFVNVKNSVNVASIRSDGCGQFQLPISPKEDTLLPVTAESDIAVSMTRYGGALVCSPSGIFNLKTNQIYTLEILDKDDKCILTLFEKSTRQPLLPRPAWRHYKSSAQTVCNTPE